MAMGPRSPDVHSRESAQAREVLARALALTRHGRRSEARATLASGIALAPEDPVVLGAAGVIAYVLGQYDASLRMLAQAGTRGAGARVHWLARERASRLGWDRDAIEALLQGAALEPDEPRWHAALLTTYAHRLSCDAAIAAGERAVTLAPDSPSLRMELANALAERGDVVGVIAHVRAAVACSSAIPLALEAGRLLRRLGEFDAAAHHYRSALAGEPSNVHARVALAELALWSGRHAEAREHAGAVLAAGPSASALRILGATDFVEGQTSDAVAKLEAALALDAREPEAHAWLAQVAIAAGRYDEAHARISAAIEGGSGDIFAGHLLRLRVKLEERIDEGYPDRHATEHLRDVLAALVPQHASVVRTTDRNAWRRLLDEALERMHGNRSSVPTYLDAGVLRRVRGVRDPRRESRLVLNRVRTDDLDRLLAEFDALVREFPASGLPLAHKGELLLWAGRLDEAEHALRRAIEIVRGTRWAYIGLAEIEILRGAPARALRTLEEGVRVMHNTKGPAVYVHEGEALYRLGRLDEAASVLEHAVEVNPTRLAAVLLLALVRIERGETEAARARFAQGLRRAPGLFSDAARESSVAYLLDEGTVHTPAEMRALLDRALVMMRGNRSSSTVTYFTSDGRLRFDARGAPGPHERDEIDLFLASQLLSRGLAVLPSPGARRPARAIRR